MKFRPQRGGLDEAMREVFEFSTLDELEAHLRDALGWKFDLVGIEKYGSGIDKRIGWDTHIVTVNGRAVGYTDGPISV